jgi:hypothetical protein
MYQSGNPEPPLHQSRKDFLAYLEKREFRGAIALDQISVLVNSRDQMVGVELEHFGEVGFTPLRLNSGGSRLTFGGYGDGDMTVIYEAGQSISVELWHSFKMGKKIDWANYLVTRSRATSASIRVRYTFLNLNDIQIAIDGSAVPSQSVTVGWGKSFSIYDMQNASNEAFEEFFGAGICVTAPLDERWNLNTKGKNC